MVGHDVTSTAVITVSNASPSLASVGTLSVTNDFAGSLTETGAITQLSVGRDLTGTVGSAATPVASLGTLKVNRNRLFSISLRL